MAKKRYEMNSHFGPRARFNWGFHDATRDAEWGAGDRTKGEGNPLPDDRFYCEGYARGIASYAELGRRLGNSEPAWESYLASLKKNGKGVKHAENLLG